MNISNQQLLGYLKKYFGFTKFKGLQERVVKSVLDKENAFAIMPTGGGKSLCYQLPALIKEGTAIVISPLIALMKNQVDAVRGSVGRTSVAHVLNSSLNKVQIQEVFDDIDAGKTKLLYVAPESLIKEEYFNFLKTQKISFVAIDEAHCISEWGHDFRPEYRNLKKIIGNIDNDSVICLTATATEKVQEDILKTLGISDANLFKASFNRPNLFYEVRPKTKNIYSDIIKFVRKYEGKSGIIYCLSRKKVEEVAQILKLNNINAIPYHAGLDAKTRSKHQDMFLMEDVNVVVATIAFGMGIDKPDVRFVIHHDIPKSLESYYQETGRAGRDDGEGYCLAYYAYKDIEKLEKFMANKTIAEQEIGYALLQEVVGYAETSMSRRKYLLHYFGEDFDEVNGLGADMDDNTRNPKPKEPAEKEVKLLLEVIRDTFERYKIKDIVSVLRGETNALLKSHKTDQKPFFGAGKHRDAFYWVALIRQILVINYIKKEIESYGTLKLLPDGLAYIENPTPFEMTKDHTYHHEIETGAGVVINDGITGGGACLDEKLMKMLKTLRKEVAKKKGVPPYVVFQDPSLESMVIRYPTTLKELTNTHGVSEGKARKFGKPFIELIANYVKEEGIVRPDDLILKGTGNKSEVKLYIIQNIDRKVSLNIIAESKGMTMEALLKEMETILYAGTKINIDYAIDLDDDQKQEIMDYFMESETDDLKKAYREFDGDYDEEELRIVRLQFLSQTGY